LAKYKDSYLSFYCLLVGLIKVLKDNYNETIELPQKRRAGRARYWQQWEISLLQKALYNTTLCDSFMYQLK
jgi:hypothetical protein